MTYDEYLATSLPEIKVTLPDSAPEGFCSHCLEIAKFWTGAYDELLTSDCCFAPPVRLKLIRNVKQEELGL